MTTPACHCRAGWVGHTRDGRPIPCTRCKPHLAGPWSQVNDCDPNPRRDRR